MNLTEKSGFFPEYYVKIKKALGENEINQFTSLKTDLDRATYLQDQKCIRENELKMERKFGGKDSQKSTECKENGNVAFKNKKWIEALLFYTKSILSIPGDQKNDLAILYANRSAALFHMEKYDECLLDIERATDNGYSKEMLHKILERKARCHLAKEDFPKSIEAFQKTISALDDSKLSLEKRQKLERDSMIMMKMLQKDPKTAKMIARQKNQKPHSNEEKQFISDAIKMDFNEQEGRFIRAGHDVKIGEELLVEKPNVAALLEKYCSSHCQHCFIRTVTPIPCLQCTDVIFCSEKCKKQATYHKYECGIIPIVWKSGVSVNCHIALRLITSKPLEYFNKIKDQIGVERKFDDLIKLPHNHYLRVHNLVRHEDKRSAPVFFQFTLMARFLVQCLIEADYFIDSKPETKKSDILFITSLLLRNLQFVHYNTHEISELQKSKGEKSTQKTLFIGGGIYPTLALFNHSCDPGIVRYFRGTWIHVNAIKPIASGLQICENYGPLYTQDSLVDRQTRLKTLYCFECNCDPCIENWPKFDEMRNDVIRFRCDGEVPCGSVIEVPPEINEFMVKCKNCGQFTNILKGLKAIQDTEMINKTAQRLFDAGEYKQAMVKYIDLLKIMSEVLVPPFTDYCQAQQHIKDCYVNLGNAYDM